MCDMNSIELPLGGRHGKGLVTLVDGDYDGEYFSQFHYFVSSTGYATRKLNGKNVYLHHEVGGRPPKGYCLDHKNGNRLDNRSCNIRWATMSQNAINRKRRLGTKNLYKGVQYNGHNLFTVTIQGKFIGSFANELEAAGAYNKEAILRYGEFAQLNDLKVPSTVLL